MEIDFSAALIVGVRASSLAQESNKVVMKYNEDTGQPYQAIVGKEYVIDAMVVKEYIVDGQVFSHLEELDTYFLRQGVNTIYHPEDLDKFMVGILITGSDLYRSGNDDLSGINPDKITHAINEFQKKFSIQPKVYLYRFVG